MKQSLRVWRTSYWLLLLVWCGWAANLSAQPLLWQVDKPGLPGSLWLFGSLHYGAPDFYPLPDQVVAAYESADALLVELDVSALDERDMQALLRQEGFLEPPLSLQKLVDDPLWQQLAHRTAEQTADLAAFSRMRPWLVALQLAAGQMQQSAYQSALGIDRHFIEHARHTGKTIVELETFEQQIHVFSRLSDSDQAAFLASTLHDYEQAPIMLEGLATAWRAGDAKQLEAHIFPAFAASAIGEVLFQRVFVERNYLMVQALREQLQIPGQLFVVTGVGHMLGDEGLVCLLLRDGYRVRTQPDNGGPDCPDV